MILVRLKGLEPPHLSIPEPKSGASTSSATAAARADCHKRCDKSRPIIHSCLASYLSARLALCCGQSGVHGNRIMPLDILSSSFSGRTRQRTVCSNFRQADTNMCRYQ